MLRFYRSALFLVCTMLAWGWFAALMRVDRRHRYRWFWWALLPLGAVFYVLDVAFNWIVGTLIWFEVPREFTYTARLKRMRGRVGFDWQASILNGIDPGHV